MKKTLYFCSGLRGKAVKMVFYRRLPAEIPPGTLNYKHKVYSTQK